MVSLSRHVFAGQEIEAAFISDDPDYEWFQGIVKDVIKYGKDASGNYVECNVLFDDGEYVSNWRFYDDDYGDNLGEGAWRFVSPLSGLIHSLLDRVQELAEDDEDYEDTDEDDEGTDTDEDNGAKYECTCKIHKCTYVEPIKGSATSLSQGVMALFASAFAVSLLIYSAQENCHIIRHPWCTVFV